MNPMTMTGPSRENTSDAATVRPPTNRAIAGSEFARGGSPARLDRTCSGQRLCRLEPGGQTQWEPQRHEISRPEEGVLDLLMGRLG